MMRSRTQALLRSGSLLFAFVGIGAGTTWAQAYLSSGLGIHFAPQLRLAGNDNDRPSYCDEYFNPQYGLIPECTAPNHVGDTWFTDHDSTRGVLAEEAAGYRFSRRFRVEGEYLFRAAEYDQTAPIGSSGGVSFAKLEGEIVRAEERIGDLSSHNLFANMYFDFPNESRFTPYVGAGAGVGFHELDWGSVWARNLDPRRITSGQNESIPDYEQFRERLAGSTTSEQTELSDTIFGWQVLFGGDFTLTESVTLGVKGRWVDFGDFNGGGEWDQLRSHVPNLRFDGSEPINYQERTANTGFLGVSLVLKYFF